MRIATITNWAYGTTVCLTIVSGIAMVMASSADRTERIAVEQRARFDQLSEELTLDAFELSDQARLFVVSGDPSHALVYRRELGQLEAVEKRTAALRDAGANEVELRSLHDALRWVDTLHDEQQAAIANAEGGKGDAARRMVFGPEYERELERVRALIGRFQYMLDQRTERAIADATVASQRLRMISEVVVGITALLFLFVLGFILKYRILKPVVKLSDVVNRLAAQDYAVEPPQFSQIDEIGDMAQAIRLFRENGIERQRLERERDADWAIRDLLARMTQRLQGCESTADLADIVALFAPQIAPGLAGRLYVQGDQLDLMNCLVAWQSPAGNGSSFAPDECWALRRGQLHRPGGAMIDIPCRHLAPEVAAHSICVPLTAQGETIGLLCFERRDTAADVAEPAQVYLELMAETVGLSLVNLKLRAALQQKALVDSLTGLRNRHQLDETLGRLAVQTEQSGIPISALMIDIDHFKRLNDRFGHEAGDLAIKAIAGVINGVVRDADVAFRYGGEEFLLLLPALGEAEALERAALIRERVAGLSLQHDGAAIGPVTVSMGLACVPAHGSSTALVKTADAALLRAKEQGRDRVIVAEKRKSARA